MFLYLCFVTPFFISYMNFKINVKLIIEKQGLSICISVNSGGCGAGVGTTLRTAALSVGRILGGVGVSSSDQCFALQRIHQYLCDHNHPGHHLDANLAKTHTLTYD